MSDIVKETDALTMWCPFARCQSLNHVSVNRLPEYKDPIQGLKCLGQMCMAWKPAPDKPDYGLCALCAGGGR